MTDLWDSEAAEYLDDESVEWYEDGEDLDFGDSDLFGEAKSAAQKRREAAQRRAALARRRALEMRRRAARSRARPKTAAAAIRQTRSDINRVNLQSRVQSDAVGGAVKSLRTRSMGLERTVSAEALGDALNREVEKFRTDLGDELADALQSVVDLAPLVFVRSPEKGPRNPAVVAGVLGGALTLGGLIIRRIRDNETEVKNELVAPRTGQQTTK